MILEDTGERFLPWNEISATYHEHLHRYALAREFTLEKKVLDLACGEGYGVNILAKNAKSVTGIDYDEKIISHAKNKYKQKNIEFLKGDITDVPIKDSKLFDVIVCFEAIEHVDEPNKLLQEVKRLLKEDGIFLISTPNKIVYDSERIEQNPFHKKELTLIELQNLLQSNFSTVKMFGQRYLNTSNIWPLNDSTEKQFEEIIITRSNGEFEFNSDKNAKYFFAISTDKQQEININPTFLADPETSKTYPARLENEIKSKNEEILRAAVHISNLENEIKSKNEELSKSDKYFFEIEKKRPKYYSSRI